jgi:uroporphyrinogen-III synthase
MTKVAVTTTPDTAPRIVDALVDEGLEPVELPCIRIEVAEDRVLERLRSAAAHADVLVLTSRRPVAILWPEGRMPAVPVIAVGVTTARAVEEAAGSILHVGTGGSAALEPFLRVATTDARVVFPRARASDPSTESIIAGVAAELVSDAAYDTVPIGPPTEPPVDAVLFGSPSAIAGWTMTRSLDDLVIGVMGETTGAALERLGRSAAVRPAAPSFEALARGIADHVRHERSIT